VAPKRDLLGTYGLQWPSANNEHEAAGPFPAVGKARPPPNGSCGPIQFSIPIGTKTKAGHSAARKLECESRGFKEHGHASKAAQGPKITRDRPMSIPRSAASETSQPSGLATAKQTAETQRGSHPHRLQAPSRRARFRASTSLSNSARFYECREPRTRRQRPTSTSPSPRLAGRTGTVLEKHGQISIIPQRANMPPTSLRRAGGSSPPLPPPSSWRKHAAQKPVRGPETHVPVPAGARIVESNCPPSHRDDRPSPLARRAKGLAEE